MRAGLGEAPLMRYAIPAIFKDGFGIFAPILRRKIPDVAGAEQRIIFFI
jgi:hypothetical protein